MDCKSWESRGRKRIQKICLSKPAPSTWYIALEVRFIFEAHQSWLRLNYFNNNNNTFAHTFSDLNSAREGHSFSLRRGRVLNVYNNICTIEHVYIHHWRWWMGRKQCNNMYSTVVAPRTIILLGHVIVSTCVHFNYTIYMYL